MPVTDVQKDLDALTMTMTGEFDAPPERLWQVWEDPRQLERWWGPPTYPATVTDHALRPGGRVAYHMTGPTGDEAHGWWEIVEVDPPRSILFRDGFARDDGSPDPDLPVTNVRVTIADIGGGRSRMSIETVFPSAAAMQQVLDMGAEEGARSAMAQIDAVLAG
jgi:uncharacterized protein YndB with AHSA1/START domain